MFLEASLCCGDNVVGVYVGFNEVFNSGCVEFEDRVVYLYRSRFSRFFFCDYYV